MNANPLWVCHNTPFQWGTNDCALMAANYVLAKTGVDFAAEFRGKYNSKYSAYRLIAGTGGLEGVLLKKGFVKVMSSFAKVGDVAVLHQPKKADVLGIVTHNHNIVVAGGITAAISDNITIYRK